jgi:hypothetical protein
MRKRHRFTGAGTRNDEQRSRTERLVWHLAAIFRSLALGWIQQRQVIIDVLGRLHFVSQWKDLYFYTVLDEFTRSGDWFYEKFFY